MHHVFQAFEHASYSTKHMGKEGKILPEPLFDALKRYAGDKELPYYTLTANGVRFHQYVGAIQIGPFCIEVLPKIDRHAGDESIAQGILVDMLRQSGYLSVQMPTESNLKLRKNFILEAYTRLFLEEAWKICHNGLVKYYYQQEGNRYSMKGRLILNRHLIANYNHAERFYVRFLLYDNNHPLNRLLYKTLKLLGSLNLSPDIFTELKVLTDTFPQLTDIEVNQDFFDRIRFNRKTEAYRKAVEIARLLLLNYHPDLSKGHNHVLALMFDMNELWEIWFTRRIAAVAKSNSNITIRSQVRKLFWEGSGGVRVNQKPDIIIEACGKPEVILDTKWKILNNRPSEEDLRQMFVYNQLFRVKRSYLIYPGVSNTVEGNYFDSLDNGTCGLRMIPFVKDGRLNSEAINTFFGSLIG